MNKKEINSLKPGTLLKVVPRRHPQRNDPNVAMFFDIANNEFFEVPEGEYVLFLKKSPFSNIVGLYKEKVVTVVRRDIEKVEL